MAIYFDRLVRDGGYEPTGGRAVFRPASSPTLAALEIAVRLISEGGERMLERQALAVRDLGVLPSEVGLAGQRGLR